MRIKLRELLGFHFHFGVLSTYSTRKLKVTSLSSLPEYGKREVTRSTPNAVYPGLISSEHLPAGSGHGQDVSLPEATYTGDGRQGGRLLAKP